MESVHAYFSKIGKKGGSQTSAKKRDAARRNILKRWSPDIETKCIGMDRLIDGSWYFGKGRASLVGRWDSKLKCFWVIGMNTWMNPKTFPEGEERHFRLKQESHIDEEGSFMPLRQVDV